MDLGFTSGLAELLEEQRRKRELEALKQQEAAAQQEPAATSPVLTPEVSTNGAQTAAPAGDSVAGVSGSAGPGNAPRNSTGGLAAGRQGVGYGMSAAAEDANQLGANIGAAGQAALPPTVAAPAQEYQQQLPVGVVAPGGNPAQELATFMPKATDSPVAMPEGRQVAEESSVGGIGAALARAGVAPPNITPPEGAPADPLAPKPKLTARQRAEAEIPAVDDMKGWQKVLLVMGAGLAGGLTKDASLGAKLAAMTPQNRRERLVKERVKEIQEQDKLDLETRQTEAQIAATEKGTERAGKQLDLTAKEQEFSQNLRLANLDIDVRRLRLDEDVRRMDAETKAAAVKAREAYNTQVLELRRQALEKGVQLQAGAQLVDPQTGQIIADNPYQPQVTTSKDEKKVVAPDGRTFTETNTKTETKTRGGGQDATTRAGGNVSPERKAEIDAYAKYLAAGGKWKKDIWMTAGKPAAPIAGME